MPVNRPVRVPKFRVHKATGRGYVALNGQAVCRGRADKPEAERRYHPVIAEWLTAGQQPQVERTGLTAKELRARCRAAVLPAQRGALGQPLGRAKRSSAA